MADNPNPNTDGQNRQSRDRRSTDRRSLMSKAFNMDAYIFREHESGQEAFIIKSGKDEIFKRTTGIGVEKDSSIAILTEGEMFGEMALIDDSPRMASARAYGGPAVVSVITQEQFKGMLETVNPFVVKLLRILADYARKKNHDLK